MFELVSLYPFVVVLSDYPKLLSGLRVLQPIKVLKKVQHGAEEVEVTNPLACKLSINCPKKNALSESSSCKLIPQRDKIHDVLNLIPLRRQLGRDDLYGMFRPAPI